MTTPPRHMMLRSVSAARLLVLCAGLVLAVGGFAGVLREPLLAAAIGPTLYVLVVHPETDVARVKNAVLGHSAAIGSSLLSLALLGLWRTPPVLGSADIPFRRTAAAALAIGLTVALLELVDAHHAPAAATALLVAIGISRPGPGLTGLVVGLLAVIALAPALAQLPLRDITSNRHTPPPSSDQGVSR
jgi:hypothetical protein